jgi:hypothetical protein
MTAPAKGLLKTVSILFIIGGGIMIIVSLALALSTVALSALAGPAGAALSGLFLILVLIALLDGALMLVLGIIGVGKKSGNPGKAGYYIITGIILCVISLLVLIIGIAGGSFQWIGLVGIILPLLYIIGGAMNKKAVASQL